MGILFQGRDGFYHAGVVHGAGGIPGGVCVCIPEEVDVAGDGGGVVLYMLFIEGCGQLYYITNTVEE